MRLRIRDAKNYPKKIYKLFENADEIKDMIVGLANIKYVDRDKVVDILEKKSKVHQGYLGAAWEFRART
ncbi:hypothetical protein RCO48_17350 [Peribacillus frigoritolerans]|nr:hypothetical protein [Peribacillus frigoritolerans]